MNARSLATAWLCLAAGCAPIYYGSIVYDLETTIACEACPEGNPLVPDTKDRAVLYGYSALWAAALTVATERLRNEKHRRLVYAVATAVRLVVGTLNLRYLGGTSDDGVALARAAVYNYLRTRNPVRSTTR